MKKPWLRWALKILLVYFIACMPDMWKLASLGPPLSLATVVFILASSLVAPPVYLVRIIFGEIAYLGHLPRSLSFSQSALSSSG